MTKKNETPENKEAINYKPLLCGVCWDVDVIDFNLPSNMNFSFGSEFDDTSTEAFRKNNDDIRWVIFRVNYTWYVMEQQKSGKQWLGEIAQKISCCLWPAVKTLKEIRQSR